MTIRYMLCVVLSACTGYTTTQVFHASAASLPADIAALKVAIDAANKVAGCELLRYDEAQAVNVVFSTERACDKTLVSNGDGGLTTLDITGDIPQICVESLTTKPETFGDDSTLAVATVLDLHEMGHAAGLDHTKSKTDVMFPSMEGGPYTTDSLAAYVKQLTDAGATCLDEGGPIVGVSK